jgi:dihydropyrimidinase
MSMSNVRFDLCIRGGTLITASERFQADIGIRDGRILMLGRELSRADRDIDATGLLVMPGGVDAHCHIEEPAYQGAMLADDFDSATRAAACGGTTTIMPFVNRLEGASMRESAEDYAGRASARARIDYAFHMIFGESSIASIKEELPGLMQEGYLSVKVFMNYPGFMLDDERILDVMDTTRRHGGLTMVHAENGHCVHWLSDKLAHSQGGNLAVFAATAPAPVEREATHRAITLAQLSGARTLLVHVSAGEAAEQIRWAHAHGIPVLAETCPQYLVRTVEDLARPGWEGAKFLCSPPLETQAGCGAALARPARRNVPLVLVGSLPVPHRRAGRKARRRPDTALSSRGSRLAWHRDAVDVALQRGCRRRPHHARAIRRTHLDQSRQDLRPVSAQGKSHARRRCGYRALGPHGGARHPSCGAA